jgi:Family of unknown function (DUF5996)
VKPDSAFYSDDLGEFILPYDRIRESESPDEILFEFLQTTYEAAANLAQWDRAGLERSEHPKAKIEAQSGSIPSDDAGHRLRSRPPLHKSIVKK